MDAIDPSRFNADPPILYLLGYPNQRVLDAAVRAYHELTEAFGEDGTRLINYRRAVLAHYFTDWPTNPHA